VLEAALELAISTAYAAGELLLARLDTPLDTRSKGLRDVVTAVDLEAQSLIAERLLARFPDHGIWAEEGDAASRGTVSEYTWIIDPLDGTNNYSRHHPTFCTSIALARGTEVVLGAVYEPMRDFLFHGQRGIGAYVNGQRLGVSATSQWSQAMVANDWARSELTRTRVLRMVNATVPQIFTQRTLGAAALGFCYVAAGWLDVYFSLHLNAWDMAAGALFVEEAGGMVTAMDGHPWELEANACLASNGRLHPYLLQAARQALLET